jgi:hypothetical protein
MKKLILGSAALTLFSISILIFQISCKKDAVAQTTTYTLPPATTSTLGGIIVGNGLSVTSNGTLSVNSTSGGLTQLNKIIYTKLNTAIAQKFEIWTANYDGTNQTKVNITMPTGFQCAGDGEVKLSPNGQKIFFTSLQPSASATHIFTCNIDGTGLTKIIDGTSAGIEGLFLGAAY